METNEPRRLEGDAKQHYLELLDAGLGALSDNLASATDQHSAAVLEFGQREGWNWHRLPRVGPHRTLATLLQHVRETYHWFQWYTKGATHGDNRGYFERVHLDASSGLPWTFDLVELHQLAHDASSLLQTLTPYEGLARELRRLLTSDDVDLDDLATAARAVHWQAMQRSFFEKLQKASILGWKAGACSAPPLARLVIDLGVEQLWRISFLRYFPERAHYAAYVVDLWQDRGRAKTELLQNDPQGARVDDRLLEAFQFSAENPAWYLIASLDERFDSLHPVHVSRAIVGPFVHNFCDRTGATEADVLPAVRQILATEPNTGVLHLTRHYSFAPHHELRGGKPRQIVYRQNWHERLIACSARHAARLARSVLGTEVHVVKV